MTRVAAFLLCITGFAPAGIVACKPADAESAGALPEPVAEAAPSWSTAAPLPEERTEVSAVSDGTRLYLAGGFGGGPGRGTAPRTLWGYDPTQDGWTEEGELPEGVNHAGFVHIDGRLYIVGGFRGATFAPIGDLRIYDLGTRVWSVGAPMPTPRGAMGVAVLNGRIHAIGGNASGPQAVHEHDAAGISDDNSVVTHEVYDPATDRWERLAPLPSPRNHHGAAALGGRIHVVGGRVDGDFELTTHDVYDPENDRWESAPAVPTGRSGVAVVEAAGKLYMFGGERMGAGGRTFDDAERFDLVTGDWERLPPMPTARHGLGAAVLGDRIHVVSGGPRPGLTYGNFHEVLSVTEN